MVRLTREESQARTRAKLLDAARMVIAEHGCAGASVEAIAEAAGFSKGAVYSNFASKEDLILALVDTTTDAVKRISDEVTASGTGDPEGFYSLLTKLVADAGERDGAIPLELLIQARREPALRPALAKAYRKRWDQWERLFENAVAHLGGQPVAESKLIVEVSAAMYCGQFLLWAGGVKISERRVLLDVLYRALLRLGATPSEPSAADRSDRGRGFVRPPTRRKSKPHRT